MGYIDYINAFNRWVEDSNPSDKAIVLYYGLLDLFNRRRWPDWAGIDNRCLLMLARTSDKGVAHRARDVLAEAGFIEFVRGDRRGRATEYRLLEYGGKSLPPIPPESLPPIPPESLPPNKNKIKKKTKTSLSGGGGEGATPVSEVAAAVGECLLDRGIDKSLYFGMTDAVRGEAAQITEELFSKFGWGMPGAVDISKVFDYTCHREGVRDETQITFQEERVKLLAYAFEAAAMAGKQRDWNYIDGVMKKLAQRGIDTVEKAEDYDYERNGGYG